MAQHEYKCQSCFHRYVCPEYHPETYSCVHHLDEADVAPRAEVAREIFEEIEKTVNDCVVGKSLFKPAYFEFRKFNEHLAELKKKYTEAETPKGG